MAIKLLTDEMYQEWLDDLYDRIDGQESTSTPYTYTSLVTWWVGTKERPSNYVKPMLRELSDRGLIHWDEY